MDAYNHWPKCETCSRTFRKQRFCDQHMNDTSHWASRFRCETYKEKFHDQKAASQHMNALRHWAPKIPCQTCCQRFYTAIDAEQHMKSQNHYKSYCRDCDRNFQNENNLKMVRALIVYTPGNHSILTKSTYSTLTQELTAAPRTPVLSVGSSTLAPAASPAILNQVPALAHQNLTAKASSA